MIAQEAAPLLASVAGVTKAEVAGGGFLNIWLDKGAVLAEAVRTAGRTSLAPEEGKIIIEHTNINPNKAAHIGHLRNACLGDTLARCLRYKGEKVEVQNYIDDTGVQVVDVVFGFMELERKTVEDLERSARQVRLLLLGPLRPGLRLPRRASRGPGPQVGHHEDGSSTASTPNTACPATSRGASSRPTWRRWPGWASSTTSCPARAPSST